MRDDVTIGIIGAANERHCIYVQQELERQGASVLILDNMASSYPLTLTSGDSGHHAFYEDQPLEEVQVYFLRALFLPTPAFDVQAIEEQIKQDGYIAYAAQRERYAAWLSLLKCLPLQRKLLVNPVDTLLQHFAKPYQIEMLRAAGIPVPQTLVTASSSQVIEFAKNRTVVYKPVAGGAHCRKLQPEDLLPERLALLSTAPAIFQEYADGVDIRVFVLGGKVIGAFEMAAEGIDYRIGDTKVKPISISESIASICIRACEAVGLLFSGVDLKLRSDGSVTLIECNPSPMFEGFDKVADQSIVSQLCSYLIQEAYQRQGVTQ